MAARDTFEWLVGQFWPSPDPETKKFIHEQREYLMTIRSENDRELFIGELLVQMREMKKRKPTS